MQKYEKFKEAVKPLKRLILDDAATVFTRIEKEEEKIHKKVLSAETSLQKLAALPEKEKEEEKIKKKISAAEKKIEEAKRKEKEFCIAVKPMYAAIADVIEHQKERPMTLWFEILDDEIAAAPGVKIEEHVIYATCVVKVTKENFAGQEGLDESVQKMIADGKFGERYFALIKRPEAGDKKEYEFLEIKKGWRPECRKDFVEWTEYSVEK